MSTNAVLTSQFRFANCATSQMTGICNKKENSGANNNRNNNNDNNKRTLVQSPGVIVIIVIKKGKVQSRRSLLVKGC